MTRAQKRKALLKAAEIIASGQEYFSCVAIYLATPKFNAEFAREYIFFLKENGVLRADEFGIPADPEAQLARSLAILFFRESLK